MPVSIRKVDGKYSVSTPNQTHAFGTTKKKAERQANLLRAVDHGWKPTGKAAREAVHVQASQLASALLEVDQIGSVPIPASGKAYSRVSGMRGLRNKQRLYKEMARDLGDKGKPLAGFKNYDGSAFTGRKQEGMDNAPVTKPLERHKTITPKFHGGKYGKGVNPKGKTAGQFQFPGNYDIGHAMKY